MARKKIDELLVEIGYPPTDRKEHLSQPVPSLRQRVLSLIITHARQYTNTEISKVLNAKPSHVSSVTGRLFREKKIARRKGKAQGKRMAPWLYYPRVLYVLKRAPRRKKR